ncbi:MAG: GGDEF domain-containing protein, partial [Elusimicrobia bacterium]|nr:GGDEF domain-containing protein [Elusimicrobiota bacterium]
ADALAGSVRESDICGRLGGDEFAILLPQSNLDAAQGTIHRIQSALDALNAGRKPPIGISMGARELDHKNMRSVDELLAEADAEMYRVKHARKALAGLHGGQKGPCGMEDLLALADAEMNRAKAVRKNEPPHAPQAQG